jgi:predicted nucleotidyltransferase component of viral defense system
LVFRGGTALARIYWPDYRLSEDLDFTSEGPIPDLQARLEKTVQLVSERTTLDLELSYGAPQSGWSRSILRWGNHELLVDINMDVTSALGSSDERADLPYKDLQGSETLIPVLSLAEILGNKWYMLDDRREPRDLFDVWSGLIQFDVEFEEIERGHRAKYGFAPSSGSLYSAKRLEGPWKMRLAHQLADLPSFDEVYRGVKGAFEEWQQRQISGSSGAR